MKNVGIYDGLIYETNYKFDYEKIKNICDIMLDVKGKFPEEIIHKNSYSSFLNPTQPHNQIEFEDYYEYIRPLYTNLIHNIWRYPIENGFNYKIINSWISTYQHNGHITEHNHENAVCVVVGYILLKENGGLLKIRDPYYDFKKNIMKVKNEDWLWKDVEIKENTVLFFQGGMYHKSGPNLSNENRLVITTNIGIENKKKLF